MEILKIYKRVQITDYTQLMKNLWTPRLKDSLHLRTVYNLVVFT